VVVLPFSLKTKSLNTIRFCFLTFSTDVSYMIDNDRCPIIHFAQAEPDYDGMSVNIFGAGSYSNGTYSPTMSACQFNTSTQSWSELVKPNAPVGRRNAAFETTTTGQTIIWGKATVINDINVRVYNVIDPFFFK
jgi:hypothetical protein